MPRRLACDVYLAPKPFELSQRYPAGTAEADLPEGVAARIVNPAAWVDIEDAPEGEGATVEVPVVGDAGAQDEPAAEVADGEQPSAPAGRPGEPPRRGAGATQAAWASFAAALGQPVAEDLGRDEIIAQLIEAGFVDAAPAKHEG